MNHESTSSLDELLTNADWIRRLARRLVRDEASADELVQDALIQAWLKPPAEQGNLRGWLA